MLQLPGKGTTLRYFTHGPRGTFKKKTLKMHGTFLTPPGVEGTLRHLALPRSRRPKCVRHVDIPDAGRMTHEAAALKERF